MNLFTYGSLMFDAVWKRIVAGHYESCSATLFGFSRKCAKDEPYPVIFRGNKNSRIDGILYLDITPKELILLDEFEGECYAREPTTIHPMDGTCLTAETYVLKRDFRHIATDRDWDAKAFEHNGLHEFLAGL